MTVRLRKSMRITPGEVTNLCVREKQRGTAFGGRVERVKTGEVTKLCARERQRGTAFGGRKERVKTGEVTNRCAREDREIAFGGRIERNRNVR